LRGTTQKQHTAKPYHFNGHRFDVADVSLIDHRHPIYHAWQRVYRDRNRQLTAKTDNVAAEYGRRLQRWEALVRLFIASTGATLADTRYLAFKQRKKSTSSVWRQNCREIDLVFGSDLRPKIFCEVKPRERTVHRDHRGISQLTASIAVASARWEGVRGVLLNVYLGGVLRLLRTDIEEPNFCNLDKLKPSIENVSTDEVPTIWIDWGELLAYGMQVGYFVAGEANELSVLRHETREPVARLAENEANESCNSALRAALLSAGL